MITYNNNLTQHVLPERDRERERERERKEEARMGESQSIKRDRVIV